MKKKDNLLKSLKAMEKVGNNLIANYEQTIKEVEKYNALLKAAPEEHTLSNKVVSDMLDGWLFDMKRLCEMIEEENEHAKICFDLNRK